MAPPPRKLNLEKFVDSRAPELEALHSIVSNKLKNNFRSQRSKRRRTTSYDDRKSRKGHNKRRRLTTNCETDSSNPVKDQKKVSRKTRRRIEMSMNRDCDFITSGDGTKRLRTHLWHAKRFTMAKLWGFHLPVGLHGRGKGSRALLKWYKKGVLLHDASYYVAIQLGGPQVSLISILRKVLVPSPSFQDISHSISSGVIYNSAILHHIEGPSSKPIAPVTYMWRPCSSQSGEDESCSTSRQLWVWLHCSAYSEGYDALKVACKDEMDGKDISINCFSLEGRLAKLELIGSKAFHLLQKILHPITCTAESLWQLKKHSVGNNNNSQFKKSSILENEDDIPSHGILSLTVKDPRTLQDKIPCVPDSTNDSILSNVVETDAVNYYASEVDADKNITLPLSSSSKLERRDVHNGNVNLWDARSISSLPVEDSVLCLERNSQRMNKFCLSDPSLRMPNYFCKEQCLQCYRSCPILLLKDNNKWSIILPLSWVKAFWIPLLNNGARAIGLREKQWIACEVGLPSFPFDFPDTSAYSCYMANKNVVSEQKAECCPPIVRPFKIPVPLSRDDIQISRIRGLNDGSEKGKLCLVRVILHAYKEGVFEDGGIVYAPYPADISLWDKRGKDCERGLKMPQYAVRNYLMEPSLTMWEQPIREDPFVREYHRQQIGIITTGFVRGSQKPHAVGFCDPISLLRLQEEQEKVVPKKKREEIFVLVRNITSSAYRLGIADIVLDHQDEDVEFM